MNSIEGKMRKNAIQHNIEVEEEEAEEETLFGNGMVTVGAV